MTGDDAGDREVRALADSIYGRVDWQWARDGGVAVNMGWRPDPAPNQNARGFNISSWRGYDEGMILYILALGSPTHPIDPAAWTEWTKTYRWDRFEGYEFVQFAPLFGHQYSHIWIDFRGVQDAYMRGHGIDYFENSRRATLSQRAYAIANPGGWRGYGAESWGLSASDGPLDSTLTVDGRSRVFHTYWARGAASDEIRTTTARSCRRRPAGRSPSRPRSSLPALSRCAPATARPVRTVRLRRRVQPDAAERAVRQLHHGRIVDGLAWFDTDYLGIDEGPIVAMAENWRTGMIWSLMRRDAAVVRGMCRAGFTGGWLAGRC